MSSTFWYSPPSILTLFILLPDVTAQLGLTPSEEPSVPGTLMNETPSTSSPSEDSVVMVDNRDGEEEELLPLSTCRHTLQTILDSTYPDGRPVFKDIGVAWSWVQAFDRVGLWHPRFRLSWELSSKEIDLPMDGLKACILAWRFGQFNLAISLSRYTHKVDIDAREKVADATPETPDILELYRALLQKDMLRGQGKNLLLSQLPFEVFCDSCRSRGVYAPSRYSRYYLVINSILDRPFPTLEDFTDAQQWLKAGFAKDCETGECKSVIEDYHFTLRQLRMIEAAMKAIPQEITVRRGKGGDSQD
ncbi:hypothetical protein FRB99_007560 [Tulasnella sp. 403]|nr:hypothetical protein FRB99_007560 [Tulasnella sp. 403]